jgi:curved DNA-binding protein CbpA
MQKDYYKILQLQPSATLSEIKKAYHRLALIYHPDKNANDPYAATQFNEVKEAYEVLSNPARKDVYLQERWYNQSINKKRTDEAITPVSILKRSLELEKYIFQLDTHRMNKESLSVYIDQLISPEAIGILKEFNEPEINAEIIKNILKALNPLPLKYTEPLAQRLENLSGGNEEILKKIKIFLSNKAKNLVWDRYKIVLMLLFTILICVLIYFMGR